MPPGLESTSCPRRPEPRRSARPPLERRFEGDMLVVITDSETWADGIHLQEAGARYRLQIGIGTWQSLG